MEMRRRLWVSLVALTLLTGCGGAPATQEPAKRTAIADFEVKPLAVGTVKPCSLITAQQAGELGLVSAKSDQVGFPREGRPQTPTTCFWADSQGSSLDLQVHKADKAVSLALSQGEKAEQIKGYPASALDVQGKSCRVYVGASDEYYLVFQTMASNKPDGACALGRKAAEVAIGNAPTS
ncbi:DUF3558 domain-containing protein [Allokutzneria sp. A3M-2-11 16]|uniref:DUF3558 family protein n=1 Tax=Allokutzneria sp. A3M-2-11 16 TaxID=2962043 RepID=UPI0020B87529|nr:DUF3558 family protein [Allokutzneria sp. A3M-2-11 16]MCP3805456.1 DUF3558 domain-containing protein [Allokutzneria sp. A3M-2-11 16]